MNLCFVIGKLVSNIDFKFMINSKIYNIFLILLFIILNSLLYITILYKLNFGIIHTYFFIMILLGYYFSSLLKKFISNNVKSWKILKKPKKL